MMRALLLAALLAGCGDNLVEDAGPDASVLDPICDCESQECVVAEIEARFGCQGDVGICVTFDCGPDGFVHGCAACQGGQ